MHLYQYDLNAVKKLAHRIKTENSPEFLEQVLVKGNESAKIFLLNNPHLSKDQWERLVTDDSIDVRKEAAKHPKIPEEFLDKLRNDKDSEIQVEALCNPLTDYSVYKDAVLNRKFSAWAKKNLCWNKRVVEDVEVFGFLWTTIRNEQTNLISTLSSAHFYDYPNIDPECVHIIHDEIRSGNTSASLREEYARHDTIALPEILDTLKTDSSRPVINAVARNSAAWVSTHEYLVTNHKTPAIRISVASATKDNDLLNRIYHGTKSKDIREAVEKNPVFVNTKP